MMTQFLEEVRLVRTCLSCLEGMPSKDHIIDLQIGRCDSSCNKCIDNKDVCQDCTDNGQVSHLPPLRRCNECCTRNIRCVRCAVLVVTSDCESGNKKAFEMIAAAKENGTLPIEFLFVCLPDAAHVGKSTKCGLANWLLVLGHERANLAMLHSLRDSDALIKKVLPRDAVLNKDRMDVDSVIHLTKHSLLEALENVDHVVHSLVPDKYRINDSNKTGLYPHPLSVQIGPLGYLLTLDYDVTKRQSRLLKVCIQSMGYELYYFSARLYMFINFINPTVSSLTHFFFISQVRLHSPAEVAVLSTFSDARSFVYRSNTALAIICQHAVCLHVKEITSTVELNIAGCKKPQLVKELEERNLSTQGTVPVLKQRLTVYLKKVLYAASLFVYDVYKDTFLTCMMTLLRINEFIGGN